MIVETAILAAAAAALIGATKPDTPTESSTDGTSGDRPHNQSTYVPPPDDDDYFVRRQD